MRTALHVCDPMTAQLRFELRGSAPGGVLPALVGEDLPRYPVLGDPAREGFHHQGAALMVRDRQAHQVPGVVIQERRHVQPLMLAQQEGKQVRLPQLVRLCPLKTHCLALRLGLRRLPDWHCALGVQHPPHRRLRRTDAQEALHHVAYATAARLRMSCLSLQNGPCPCTLGLPRPATGLRSGQLPHLAQPRGASGTIALHPAGRRRVRHPQPLRGLLGAESLIHHRPGHCQTHVLWPGAPARTLACVRLARTACLALACHLSAPVLLSHGNIGYTGAR